MRNFALLVVIVLIGAGGYWLFTTFEEREAQVPVYDSDIAYLEALKDTAPDSALADQAALSAFAAAMDSVADVSFGSFESEGQGVVAKDVVITAKSSPDYGARIAELRVWGPDTVAMTAALAGDIEDAIVAQRIDAKEVEWFGLETLTQKVSDLYLGAVSDAVEGVGEPGAVLHKEMLQQVIKQYTFAAERVLIERLAVFALPAPVSAPTEADAEYMTWLQNLAQWSLVAGADAFAVYDLKSEMVIEQMGQDTDFNMSVAFSGNRHWRQADIGASVMRGLLYEMTSRVPYVTTEDDASANTTSDVIEMDMSGNIDEVILTDFRMSNLLKYLARGVWPPASEADLVSLGVWRSTGERYEINGSPLYSVGESYADLSHFYWLAPTKLQVRQRELTYHLEGIIDYVTEFSASIDDSQAARDQLEIMDASVEILKKYNLEDIVMDFELNGEWAPSDGDSESEISFQIRDFGRLDYGGKFQLPAFDAFASTAPKSMEASDWAELTELVTNEMALKSLSFAIADDGGIEKSFGLAVDFAKLAPEGDPSAAMMRNASPEDLRVSSAAMMRLSAPQLAQVIPQAKDYLNAVADLIQHGGVLRVVAAPPTPLTLEGLQQAQEDLNSNPALAVEMLGLSVTHDRPQDADRN